MTRKLKHWYFLVSHSSENIPWLAPKMVLVGNRHFVEKGNHEAEQSMSLEVNFHKNDLQVSQSPYTLIHR